MQKILFCLRRKADQPVQELADSLYTLLEQYSTACHASRFAIADNDVAAAGSLRISMSDHPQDAVVSLWCDNSDALQKLNAALQVLCAAVQCYQVQQTEPLKHRPEKGRTEGMCQIAFIKKPAALTQQDFLDIWLNSHTQIAIDTQSTFGYRQNTVLHATATGDWPLYDAIVEENFPSRAMTDRMAFFAAGNNAALFKHNQQRMIQSCSRFIDFSCFDCIPMSEYIVKAKAIT